MKVVAIIQARMTSTRLPGKVLRTVLNKPLLEYQIERVSRAKLVNEIVVATTINDSDDAIVELCERLGISAFRGSEEDVLLRYYDASNYYKSDVVVRLTSDCPVIDPEIIDSVIQMYLNEDFDYVSNTQVRTYPRGMDTEVFSSKMLKKAHYNGKKPYEREHVSPYLYLNGSQFTMGQLIGKEDTSHYRLTVDTPDDFKLIKIILEELYPKNGKFSLSDIINYFEKNPEVAMINNHVLQKKLGE